MKFKAVPWLAVSAACFLAACGGGGSSAEPPVPNNTYPNLTPQAGDWLVYDLTTTTSVPSGLATQHRTLVRYISAVNPDGSFSRVDQYSDNTIGALVNFTAGGESINSVSSLSNCSWAPAYRSAPAFGSTVATAYSRSAVQTCQNTSSGTTTVTAYSAVSGAQRIESKTLPWGPVEAFTYTATSTATVAGVSTATITETCSTDRSMGHSLACQNSYSRVLANQSAPVQVTSTTTELLGYSVRGRRAGDVTTQRFVGPWAVSFAGSSTGDCTSLAVSASGVITGTCRMMTSPGVYGASFNVAGAVSDNGATTVTASTGAVLTGQFTTPGLADGTWTNGTASGTWRATHK